MRIVYLKDVLQSSEWVLEYVERMSKRGDKDAENIYSGHSKTVVEFLKDIYDGDPIITVKKM